MWTNRDESKYLGWLDIVVEQLDNLSALQAFRKDIVDSEFEYIVLLGMGGSSLGAEVLRQTFTPVPGYPELLVLDSTVPAQVGNVARQIDPSRTLFLVSSKSGGTTETLSFYRYFRQLAEATMTGGGAGRNFVAITDPDKDPAFSDCARYAIEIHLEVYRGVVMDTTSTMAYPPVNGTPTLFSQNGLGDPTHGVELSGPRS